MTPPPTPSRRRYRPLRRFWRDQDGAVMLLTLVLSLLLTKVLMSTYNVGVLTSSKIRLQTVADAAAYSAATWQARFLNYCAFSRRAIIANHANIALLTALESHRPAISDYHDEKFTLWGLQSIADMAGAIINSVVGYAIDYISDIFGIEALVDLVAPVFFAGFLGIFSELVQEVIGWALDHIKTLLGTILNCITTTIDPDNEPGFPRLAGTVHDVVYEAIGGLQDTSRESADHLSFMLAKSQRTFYRFASQPWLNVIPDVVRRSNEEVEGVRPIQIQTSPAFQVWGLASTADDDTREALDEWLPIDLPPAAGKLNSSFVRTVPLGYLQEDVELRQDAFTRAHFQLLGEFNTGSSEMDWLLRRLWGLLTAKSIPFVASRPFWAFDLMFIIEYCSLVCIEANPRVIYLNIDADAAEIDLTSDRAFYSAEDSHPTGVYYFGWVPVYGYICLPIVWPIDDSSKWRGEYESKFRGTDVDIFELHPDLEPGAEEPSVWVVLRIPREEFAGESGSLIHNSAMPLADRVEDMYAVSRAKVFFQPRYPGDETIYEPNLYYPYWEARLAPVWGSGYSTANDTIRRNVTSLLDYLYMEATASSLNWQQQYLPLDAFDGARGMNH